MDAPTSDYYQPSVDDTLCKTEFSPSTLPSTELVTAVATFMQVAFVAALVGDHTLYCASVQAGAERGGNQFAAQSQLIT
jgi:hypothetical protein